MRVWTVNKFSGKTTWDSGFFNNKILDSGRNNGIPVQSDWLDSCHVGTDSTPPLASHTGLLGFAAGTGTIVDTTWGAQGSAPYYWWKRITFEFDVGAGHGGENLSEAGVGWATFTPQADEILYITYEIQIHPPAGDVNDTVTLNGATYDVVTRASDVNNTALGALIGQKAGIYVFDASSWRAYDGALGTVIQAPSGTAADHDGSSIANLSYVNNSYQTKMLCQTGPGVPPGSGGAGWNLTAGIRCIRIMTTLGYFQSSFTNQSGGATIPKDVNFTMDMQWILGWTEGTAL
jgi:hypothetical protein